MVWLHNNIDPRKEQLPANEVVISFRYQGRFQLGGRGN